MLLTDFIITRGPPFHRGAFCQFPLGWFYYYGINKSTGKETGKTHLCNVFDCFNSLNLSYFCLVCLEKIRPKNATWHCDGECFQVFHIHCIKKWSKTTRTNEGWRCPGKFKYMVQFLLL